MHDCLSEPAIPRPNAILIKYNGRLVTPGTAQTRVLDTQRKQSATSSFAMKYNALDIKVMSVHGPVYGSIAILLSQIICCNEGEAK